jgi:hypothetical protein
MIMQARRLISRWAKMDEIPAATVDVPAKKHEPRPEQILRVNL